MRLSHVNLLFVAMLDFALIVSCKMPLLPDVIPATDINELSKKIGLNNGISFRFNGDVYRLLFTSNSKNQMSGKSLLYKKHGKNWQKHSALDLPEKSLPPELVKNEESNSDFVYVVRDLGGEKIQVFVLEISENTSHWRADEQGVLFDGVWRK